MSSLVARTSKEVRRRRVELDAVHRALAVVEITDVRFDWIIFEILLVVQQFLPLHEVLLNLVRVENLHRGVVRRRREEPTVR